MKNISLLLTIFSLVLLALAPKAFAVAPYLEAVSLDDIKQKLKAEGFLGNGKTEYIVNDETAISLYAKGTRDVALDFTGDLNTGSSSYNWAARRVDAHTICFKALPFLRYFESFRCLIAIDKD